MFGQHSPLVLTFNLCDFLFYIYIFSSWCVSCFMCVCMNLFLPDNYYFLRQEFGRLSLSRC